MTCGECGASITYEKQLTSSKRLIPYYRRSKRQDNRKVACTQSYVEANLLEKEIAKAVEAARLPRHIVVKIEKKLAEIHEREQESVTRGRKQIQTKMEQLNEKERSLVNKYLENKLTEEIYETIREEISSERINCKARLEANESTIQAAIRVLEQAVAFTRNLPVAYKRAPDPIKCRFLAILFKKIVVKDGGLYKVVLNPPLDYLCRDLVQTKNSPVIFDGEAFGEPPSRNVEPHSRRAETALCSANRGKQGYGICSIGLPMGSRTRRIKGRFTNQTTATTQGFLQ